MPSYDPMSRHIRLRVRHESAANTLEELEYKVTEQPLLQAKEIHLAVLAPFNYYEGYQFEWLETEIKDGLKEFIRDPEGYTMDFQFQAFPWDYSFGKSIPDEPLTIIKALNDRKRG